MNKKELAKLVYNHPIVKNLYKSSDKTVINKLIAEEVLKEASSDRLKVFKDNLKAAEMDLQDLQDLFDSTNDRKDKRGINNQIVDVKKEIEFLQKKISELQKVQEPSQEAVKAVEEIVADEKKNKKEIENTIQSPDQEKLKALADKFIKYNERMSALKDLQTKVGTLASKENPSELLKAIGELLSSGKQQQLIPSLNLKTPEEKVKAAIVPSLIVVAKAVGVDDQGIQNLQDEAKKINDIKQIPAYNEFAFKIMEPFVAQKLKEGQTFDNFRKFVEEHVIKQLPALIQKEQQPQQDQAQAGEEPDVEIVDANQDISGRSEIREKFKNAAMFLISRLPDDLKNLEFVKNEIFQIWLGSQILTPLQEQQEEVKLNAEDIPEQPLSVEEVGKLNDILNKNKDSIEKIFNYFKSKRLSGQVQRQITTQDTLQTTDQKTLEEPTTSASSDEVDKDKDAQDTKPSEEPDASTTSSPETEQEVEGQIASTEQAAQKTTEAAQEDAKVQKPVQIEEFSPIMNYMNDFFLEPSNPQVAGFMENVLLKYQSKQLYKLIAHLDTILSPEFEQAFTDSSNAEKPEPQEEEPTSATPTPAPASPPATPPVTSVETSKISEGFLGDLFGSKNKEEQQNTVQIPKKNRAALREELLTLVDLLKYLKIVVSNYEKNSTKTSIFNSYKGSSMKKVMDDLMNQVQSNLSYIMNEIQNARTAAATEQSADMQATAKASNEQELEEQIYNKVLKLLKEADASSEQQTRKTNVDFVKSVYNNMRALYKTAMKTNLETLIKGGSTTDLGKLIENAKKMKGFATEEKFISLFPTGQLVSGNVVTISDGLKALEQSIEGFIGLARDVATFVVKSGEPLPSTQLTEAEYKIVDLATAIEENFGIKSKIDQAIMTKIKAGLKEDPKQTPLTDDANEEKDNAQSSEEGSTQEPEDIDIDSKLQDFKMPTIQEANELLKDYDAKGFKQEQKIFLAIIAKLLGNGGSLQEIVGESILALLFAASLSSLTKNLTELNRFEQAFEKHKDLFSGIGYENAKKLALAAANIMIKNRSMFQKFNPINSIHKIVDGYVLNVMADITNKNKDNVQQAEEQVSSADNSEDHSKNNTDEQSSETDDSVNNEEVPKEISQMNQEDKLKAAKSQDTSEQVLTNLADEVDFEIKAAIAANPKTPAEILKKIANGDFLSYGQDQENKIKAAIAANPSAPEAVLRDFKRSSALPEILASLATNPNLPEDIITDFIIKGTDKTKASLASNESLTEENFTSLYKKAKDYETAMALARNPKTPIEILQNLANGNNNEIKHQASKALRDRESGDNLQESRQLFKGQSLEEKLKPIIEKMLRQYYR